MPENKLEPRNVLVLLETMLDMVERPCLTKDSGSPGSIMRRANELGRRLLIAEDDPCAVTVDESVAAERVKRFVECKRAIESGAEVEDAREKGIAGASARTAAMRRMRDAFELYIGEMGESYTVDGFVKAVVTDLLVTHPGARKAILETLKKEVVTND